MWNIGSSTKHSYGFEQCYENFYLKSTYIIHITYYDVLAAGWFCEKTGWIGKVEDVKPVFFY